MTAIQVTRAEELEARVRKAMACPSPADELVFIDVLLDEWLVERCAQRGE